MAAKQLYCRFCGKAIPKITSRVYFVTEITEHMKNDRWCRYVVGAPTSRAEAQRLVNEEIVSIRRGGHMGRDQAGVIGQAGTWDGARFVDPYFCKHDCAEDFAFVVCRQKEQEGVLIAMPAYHQALDRTAGARP